MPHLPQYTRYYKPYTVAMPLLLKQGNTPATVEDIFKGKVNPVNVESYFIKSILSSGYTGDAIAYHSSGKFKISKNEPLLKLVNKLSRQNDSGAVIIDEFYDTIDGLEFKKKDRKYFNHALSENEALDNPAICYLLGDEVKDVIPKIYRINPTPYSPCTHIMAMNIARMRTPESKEDNNFYFPKSGSILRPLLVDSYSNAWNIQGTALVNDANDTAIAPLIGKVCR